MSFRLEISQISKSLFRTYFQKLFNAQKLLSRNENLITCAC
jgi:hypothetical protein